jgi:hypothetical protein
MDYIVKPIADLVIWTFDNLLVPVGEMGAANPNNLFIVLGFVGLFYWLFLQTKFNKEAERTGGLK